MIHADRRTAHALAQCFGEHLYPTGNPVWSDDALVASPDFLLQDAREKHPAEQGQIGPRSLTIHVGCSCRCCSRRGHHARRDLQRLTSRLRPNSTQENPATPSTFSPHAPSARLCLGDGWADSSRYPEYPSSAPSPVQAMPNTGPGGVRDGFRNAAYHAAVRGWSGVGL